MKKSLGATVRHTLCRNSAPGVVVNPDHDGPASTRSTTNSHPQQENRRRLTFSGEHAMPAISHPFALLMIVLISVGLTPTSALAQNLDQDKDKSGPKLFAATCAECHRSARGLAKGRLSILLQYYLQQHYTSSSATAQTLTAYLQSVDTPPRSKSQPGKSQPPARSAATATTTGLSAPRPPAVVPAR
jgi:mono/diheme cytochrome c family protein